jgi:hypothetical protein
MQEIDGSVENHGTRKGRGIARGAVDGKEIGML